MQSMQRAHHSPARRPQAGRWACNAGSGISAATRCLLRAPLPGLLGRRLASGTARNPSPVLGPHGVLRGVHPRHGLEATDVATAKQVPRIAVQGAVGVGVQHQRHDGAADVLQSPCRAPVGLEDVEAELPRAEVHVGMENLGDEGHLRWRHRVVCRATDVELVPCTLVGRVLGPLHKGLPILNGVPCHLQHNVRVRVPGYFAKLLYQPIARHGRRLAGRPQDLASPVAPV
mmetsp:Transcript_10297/g.23231  ORF Transcript_10297/g.23231 Transcript_10297/m.23231 type:complete len:230 (+) Transcript_10297:27-716(+)